MSLFGRRLEPPMPGPVHAVGHQLNRRRINQVDHPLETKGKPGLPSGAKARTQTLPMRVGSEEKFSGPLIGLSTCCVLSDVSFTLGLYSGPATV